MIDLYLFESETGHTVTINRERYGSMLSNFLIPAINDLGPTGNFFFQQNSAAYLDARVNMITKCEHLPGWLISSQVSRPNPSEFLIVGLPKEQGV